VKVNANAWPVCDLKPETLPGISRPPCVDAARLIELVLSSNVNHLDLLAEKSGSGTSWQSDRTAPTNELRCPSDDTLIST
jgi:hypothetical protein